MSWVSSSILYRISHRQSFSCHFSENNNHPQPGKKPKIQEDALWGLLLILCCYSFIPFLQTYGEQGGPCMLFLRTTMRHKPFMTIANQSQDIHLLKLCAVSHLHNHIIITWSEKHTALSSNSPTCLPWIIVFNYNVAVPLLPSSSGKQINITNYKIKKIKKTYINNENIVSLNFLLSMQLNWRTFASHLAFISIKQW